MQPVPRQGLPRAALVGETVRRVVRGRSLAAVVESGTKQRLVLKSDAPEGEVVLTLDGIVRKVGTDGSCGTQVEDFDLVGRLKLGADARGDQKLGIA